MINHIRKLFELEKQPHKRLFALEWVVLAYVVFTLLVIFFTYTKVQNPDSLILGRVKIVIITFALWAVYRMMPCRFTRMTRVLGQMALLSWWYPDTYELNRVFPNLDHLFASAEQWLFGCQPSLLFYEKMPWPLFSELMDLGYASYYPLMAIVLYWYFFRRYSEFERASVIVLASFFLYYVVYIFLPVTGPMFYFHAIGLDQAAQGVFPNVGHYFSSHTDYLPTPGWTDGICYWMVEVAHAAGERPTAAFPSSHVGVSTVLMLLVWHARSKKLFWALMPIYLLLCFSTVYIQAHYAIDAIAGLITGWLIWLLLMWLTRSLVEEEKPAKARKPKKMKS